MKKRRAARAAGQRNKMPLFLVGAGLLLIVGVLIWQASSITPAQTANNTNLQSDIPYPQIKRTSLDDSKKALDDQSAIFLDVRDPATFETGHIPGAINIPLAQLETRLNELDANRSIIIYCTWPAEESSARAASILESLGYKNVSALLGGFAAWQQAGYPLE